MGKETNMERVSNYLRIIERTRLLCNSSKELGELVGFSVGKGNGLSRMGGKSPFMKDAIFNELAYQVREDYGLELQQILDTYIEADLLIEKYGVFLKRESVPYSLIRSFYADEDVPNDISMVAEKLEGRHIPIIILIILGALPRISSKGGDVKDIEDSYRKVFKLLHETICKRTPFKVLPVLTQMEDIMKYDPSVMKRIHLVYAFSAALNSYGNLSTRMRLVQTNKELNDYSVFPDIDGIWAEDDKSTVFWKFERIANGFKTRRYLLSEERKEFKYTEYFFKFFATSESSWAIILHPKSIEYILSGEPIPNQYFTYVDFSLTEGQLFLEPLYEEGTWLNVRQMKRSRYANYVDKLLKNDRYVKINECQEYAYEFIIQLSAITNYHIYINASDGKYYKVPKSINACLEDLTMKDDVGVLRYGNKIYIAFDSYNLFYDVSTPQKLEGLGIEITESVSTKE